MVIQENVPLKEYTTFRVGGPARFFAVAHTVQELEGLLRHAKGNGLPLLIMSGGSNLLVSEEGFDGLVIKIALRGIAFEDEPDGSVTASVAAGESWDAFVAETVARGLWGLENLSGIPGSVGATPVQNVGAYGVEVKDILRFVEAFDTTEGSLTRLESGACRFAYRHSRFKEELGRYVIVRVAFQLSRQRRPKLTYRDLAERFKEATHEPTLSEIRAAVLAIRGRKFPDLKVYGTAGSFFKNPIISGAELQALQTRFPDVPHFPTSDGKEKVSLAWLLDRACNLKGVRHGNVGAFEHQPLVIVNYGGASSRDVHAFAAFIASCVKDAAGITIEPEVMMLENR